MTARFSNSFSGIVKTLCYTFWAGVPGVIMSKFEPLTFFKSIEKYGISVGSFLRFAECQSPQPLIFFIITLDTQTRPTCACRLGITSRIWAV